MGYRETLNYFWQLCKDTFSGGGQQKEELEKVKAILGTRTFIVFTTMIIFSIVNVLLGKSFW